MWTRIFWGMSNGNKSDFDSLKGTEIAEFWYLFDEYEKKLNSKSQKPPLK